jgi:ribonuclease Z
VFDLQPRVFDATVLLLECTFFDEGSRDNAHRYGHMHLDDLVARAGDFANRYLVVHHATRRHSCAMIERWLEERLQLPDTEVRLFGCR